MLWWESGSHQVEWDEPRVEQDDFAAYLVSFGQGNFEWEPERLREGLWRRFHIRINVQRNEPLVRGGPDHFEVVTAEGFARGVGATAEGGPLPPVR